MAVAEFGSAAAEVAGKGADHKGADLKGSRSMTPQERQLVAELFDRLGSLENAPRDADAEGAIKDGMARAPNAIYPLVQTVLVQDEALKRANARIQELEAEFGDSGGPGESPGFLDSMRGALFGRDPASRGSVPSVRPGAENTMSGPGGPPPYEPTSMAPGGSFLGNAAATAAGVIGGSLMLDGIRSMFGRGHTSGAGQGMTSGYSPWNNRAADSDLARQAGSGDVGGRRDTRDDNDRSDNDRGDNDRGDHDRAGLFDTASNDDDDYDSDFDDGFDGGDTA
jgi:hypothetical protein